MPGAVCQNQTYQLAAPQDRGVELQEDQIDPVKAPDHADDEVKAIPPRVSEETGRTAELHSLPPNRFACNGHRATWPSRDSHFC